MTPPLPAFAAWLLTRRIPAGWREFVVGDLAEEFAERFAASPMRARGWLWWQTLRCVTAPPPHHDLTLSDRAPSRGDSMLRTIAADCRYSLRVLLRTPSFALAVISVLALGIGANTALFSIVNGVLLRPLSYERPERLVRLYHVPPQSTFPGMTRFSVSPANFYDWQRQARQFDGMAIYGFNQYRLTGTNGAETVAAGAVGAGFFGVVGTAPAIGRVFRDDEDVEGAAKVAILSDGFWKTHFASAPDVVGRTLPLDGEAYTIVGVMPASFTNATWGVAAQKIWVPLAKTAADRAVRDNHNESVIAGLRDGASLESAQAEMNAISAQLEHEYPQANAGWGATVVPLQEVIVGDIRRTLLMLLGAVALVLLIACANVGNLLFARGLGRRKELAIRSALGAGRSRVFQQLLVEALVLSTAAGVAGILLARGTLAATASMLAGQIPRANEVSLDGRVLLFASIVSILTGILAGSLPTLRAGRSDLNDALKEGGRNDSAVGIRTRRLLIVCEVALSVVLLMTASVMVRSLLALRYADAGFDPRNVLTMIVALPEKRYATPAQRNTFFDTALQRMRAIPGVESASSIDRLPVSGGSVQPIVIDGRAELLPRDQPTVSVRRVTPGYLHAMKVPLLQGRDVVDSDGDVLLVSRSAAKLLWNDVDPIGRRAVLPLESKTLARTVVGIVGDVKQGELSQAATPTVYEFSKDRSWSFLTLVVRTSVPPSSIGAQAASVIRAIDPEQPVENVRTMEAVVDETLASERFSALVLGVFAGVALLLASVGIYSVLSYIVRGRSREIGIRTALGARSADVVKLVLREGMTPALTGIALGAAASLGTATLLSKLVFGISASDPLTLAAVAATLGAIALAASLVPAYRAARVDQSDVLRAG